jgi:uncharacterized protein YijF (DUF1287 family)
MGDFEVILNYSGFFEYSEKNLALHSNFQPLRAAAEVAQLVERNLAKVKVASSRLVFRSIRLIVNC